MTDRISTLAAEQQPTEGEEIMVNTPHGVFTLPLHPSGLSRGPRFVVHVPELQRESVTVRYDLSPAQTESAIRDALIRLGWTPPDEHTQQSATVNDVVVERIAALLHEVTTGDPWTVAGVEHPGPDRDYYRGLAHKVAAIAKAMGGQR